MGWMYLKTRRYSLIPDGVRTFIDRNLQLAGRKSYDDESKR
jgi:hypothetical protein